MYGIGILRQQIRAVRHFKIFGVFSSLGNQFRRCVGGAGSGFLFLCAAQSVKRPGQYTLGEKLKG